MPPKDKCEKGLSEFLSMSCGCIIILCLNALGIGVTIALLYGLYRGVTLFGGSDAP